MNKWLYFGSTKDKIFSCREQIGAHNKRSLLITSLVASVLIILLSLYTGVRSKNIYYFCAFIEFAVFFLTRVLKSERRLTHIHIGMFVFMLTLIIFSAYICIFDKNPYVVRFLIFFISFEVVFIFGAFICLLVNLGVLASFALFYYFCEPLFGMQAAPGQYLDLVNISMACVISIMLNWYVSYIFMQNYITNHILEEERNRYREESISDQLTQLNNRRSFDQNIEFFTSVCRNVHQTVCIVMMDIDFFKKYNDYYGHSKGDEVLKAVGMVLKSVVKENGVFAARVGGEEFIVIWTENRILEAERIVLKIRQRILDLQMPHHESSVAPVVTASFGLYVMRGGSYDTPAELYNSADAALYKAKENGRNCIYMLDSNDKKHFKPIILRHPDDLPER